MSRISVITINYNNAHGLKKTIESVLEQQGVEVEYIIIDGGSTDGSVELLSNYTDSISKWLSEGDEGVYDAMNKGIQYATGDYCIFLNSGDIFSSSLIIGTIADNMASEEADIYYGNIQNTLPDGTFSIQKFPAVISLMHFSYSYLGHPSTIIRRNLLIEMGGYSLKYKIISDWLFFVQALIHGARFKYIDLTISIFEINGLSGNLELLKKEHNDVLDQELFFLKEDFRYFADYRTFWHSRVHLVLRKLISIVKRNQDA